MKLALALLLTFALSSCSSAGKATSKANKADKKRHARVAPEAAGPADDVLQIIDAHTHTEFTGQPEPVTGISMTQDAYFKELKEANAVGAISHTHQGGSDYFDLRSRGIMHCAGVTARPNFREIEQGLKSGKYGCIKVYLGYQHQGAGDVHYQPLYKLAAKYDIPVVFHTGDTYSAKAKLKFADPLTIDEVAVDNPKVKFVIAHCGNPWIESAAEVAYKNPNVFLDGSAFLIGNLDKMPQDAVDEYLVKPVKWIFGYVEDPTKLMFGSDWPLNNIAAYARAFKRAIPKEHWKAVFHDNAVRVFKLHP